MKYFICLLVLLNTINLNAQNLITNPGFENSLDGWTTQQNNESSANFLIETNNSPEGDNHFKIEVNTLGKDDWDVQLISNEFEVDQSHQYRLTFKAKSANPGATIKVYFQSSSWMGKSFTLSDSWETYSYEFFPNEPTKQLKFNFVEISDYFIDDIVLEDITPGNSDFNTPPSCVITAPHVNACFKSGSDIAINAYATDIGGSGMPGEISMVEFFIDDQKIGESTTEVDNTYSIVWEADDLGKYQIKAVATDTTGKSFTSAGVLISIGTDNAEKIGLSAGKGKYLGNNVRNSGVEPTFLDYWNAVTSGNGGKWGTVERNRNVMNWEKADEAYNLAEANNLPYRYHTLAWGAQYPDWIKTLEPSAFQEEMEEFISAVADRYPYIDQIDVINEALPGHQDDTQFFIDGLGGAGESGYDWAVWLFKKAREYFPNSKLILNDFGLVNSSSNIKEQLLLLQVLRDSALVDGFGAQAHTFHLDGLQANVLKENLDLMANAGVPIYITEMDIEGRNADEASQLSSYQNLFPVLWEHPGVAGITLWGYIYGDMWIPDAGLVYEDGTERSSMQWLRDYMEQQEDVGYPMSGAATSSDPRLLEDQGSIEVYPNPSKGKVTLSNISNITEQISIYDFQGRQIDFFELNGQSQIELNLLPGLYLVKVRNQKTMKLIVR